MVLGIQNYDVICFDYDFTLREKCPYSEFCWDRFPVFGLNDTEYLSVFSPKAGKYKPEKRSELLHHPILFIIRKIWSKVSILGIIHLLLTQFSEK